MPSKLARRTRAGITACLLAVAALLTAGRLSEARAPAGGGEGPPRMAPVRAVGVRVDTLLVGGYAHGRFADALQVLVAELAPEERALAGEHLDKIFAGVVETDGLGRTGRLRVALARAVRPDGSTRSIRVLAAEAAVAGEMHTALYFERAGKPGYYDPFGRSLDPDAWAPPLASLRVTSGFGARRMHPILGRVLPHAGVDYGAAAGTPVRATGDGYVSFAGPRGGYGNLVEIQHPSGYSTRYAHLSSVGPGMARGALVRQGAVVGRVGMTGLATGPHLHYELRRQGQPVNPQRMEPGSGVSAELAGEPGWAAERQRLGQLLARVPTVLQAR